jgi:CDGSH-type Zn-finger protein
MEDKGEKKFQARIEVLESGPLRITGNFIINDIKRGIENAPGEILLCTCGKSKNKPYCDDSHLRKEP